MDGSVKKGQDGKKKKRRRKSGILTAVLKEKAAKLNLWEDWECTVQIC